jgi:dephospho-CoA kinase
MLRVGLTGGIGSGKSTVARRLAEHGAVVIDADRLAREVVEPGTDGLREVVAAFGAGVLDADGALNRPALAERVFGDDTARATLNAIVHPRIGARRAALTKQASADAILVDDVPLLVETGMAAAFHLVIVVDAPVETRVQRLVHARGLPEADARARIATQATDEARRAVADVWLNNAGPVDQVLAAVDLLWADRLVPYEANVRLRRYAPRGGPVVVDYDSTWPAQAARLAARLRFGAGARALRVDHVGSTSVPGLAAKNVLDFQVTVASPADAEALAEPLADAGFPYAPGFDVDTPHWPKRTHVSADPARWANVHLRVAGAPNWRFALLFAAWLRADEPARREYADTKRKLAAEYADRTIPEYGRAKDSWLAEAGQRAEEWAQRTGWQPPRT